MDHGHQTPHGGSSNPPSKAALMSSAKVVADAAKATMSHESNKIDKAKVAGAAADLLGAASHYGKVEEKGYGKYVEKADTYLHKYGSPAASHPAAGAPHPAGATGPSHTAGAHPPGTESGGSGGKYGSYIKMAEGLLKKQSGGGGSAAAQPGSGGDSHGSGGGYGQYMKMAEGLLKKQSGGGGSSAAQPGSGGDNHGSSGGGYGQYIKMAEGLLKKQSK